MLRECLGISQTVVVAFASLVFLWFGLGFFPPSLTKLSLTQPMNFLSVALLIVSPIPLWGAVSAQL